MRLYDRISKATGGNGGEKQELPPTPILKDFFREQVDSLRASLRSKKAEVEDLPDFTTKLRARCDEVEKLIDQMEKAVDSIEDSLKEEQALGKLQMAMRAKPQVEQRIRFLMDDVRVR
jgi:chromosome segregation ATPase